jgi:ethanolamine ammonia-lyase small subunit
MSDKPASPPASAPPDSWTDLRRLTGARIGLKRSGASLATGPLLDFQLAHARARDAVHAALDEAKLAGDLRLLGDVLTVSSLVEDRQTYLMRPDLGRTLSPLSEAALQERAGTFDVAFAVIDGLSPRAVETHSAPVLANVLPALRAENWRVAPLVVLRHGRVAAGDAVATLLRAQCVAVLIGERPGLSAPDSMGAYLTWRPGATTTDAERNCISNIRPDGIAYTDAAAKIVHLLRAMRARKMSGVRLKDDSEKPRQVQAPSPNC